MEDTEWDDAKDRQNLAQHGVDFTAAARVFLGPVTEGPDPRWPGDEPRWLALGQAEGVDLLVVFTWRGTRRRIISAWRLGRESKARYQKVLARRAAEDAGHDPA